MSKQGPMTAAQERDYYRELAHLWETACHDFRAYAPEFYDDPPSYHAAVAFAAQRQRKGE